MLRAVSLRVRSHNKVSLHHRSRCKSAAAGCGSWKGWTASGTAGRSPRRQRAAHRAAHSPQLTARRAAHNSQLTAPGCRQQLTCPSQRLRLGKGSAIPWQTPQRPAAEQEPAMGLHSQLLTRDCHSRG